jgi:hypothetical protein
LADSYLTELLGDTPDCALVAVGGYGRGELAPASDIDVILVHRGRRDVIDLARRIWYPIWDAGVPLDHGVKTITEALGVAARDLKAAMGLLTARCVAGEPDLAADLAKRALDQWRSNGKKWLRALGEATPCYIEPGESLIGHPTYCIRFRGNRFFPDTLPAGLQTRMSFDAGKDIELGVPIRPGDRITVVSTLHDLYEKTGRSGSMIFVVIRFTMTNQRGELVAAVDNRMMYRGEG